MLVVHIIVEALPILANRCLQLQFRAHPQTTVSADTLTPTDPMSINANLRAVTRNSGRECFIWSSMNNDIRQWTSAYLACQKAKIGWHNKAPTATFLAPDTHMHIDLVRSLPISRGCNYLLTAIDRVTWWSIATPLSNITADTVAHAFLEHWISHYGIPSTITTD
ncbi:unnamed protein product [Schistocephalus solidus]|uniref:Integrase catalytic domain-containing protein n=1 Tax=Schistocephalus solidus TaxID=70667 RepID=A0A183TFY0_SCHSO|nr:unnamed protein product [Schistocephalus solidus]